MKKVRGLLLATFTRHRTKFSTGWKFRSFRCCVHTEPPCRTKIQKLTPFKVPCEQSENIEPSGVNEGASQIFFSTAPKNSSRDEWTYPDTMKWMLRVLWSDVNYDLIGYSRHTNGEVDFFLRQHYCLPWFVIYSVYSTNWLNVAVRLFISQIDFYPWKIVL